MIALDSPGDFAERALRPTLPTMVPKRDYYEVLSVDRDSAPDEIKRAYRKLAMRFHPDRNPDDPAAEDSFKEASEAYAVLSDEDKRRKYDRFGHSAFDTGAGGFDPTDFGAVSEILEGLFGDVFRGGKRRKKSGRDLTYDLEVTFEQAALGAEVPITINKPSACVSCRGDGAEPGTPVRTCTVCQGRGQVKFQWGFLASNRPCHGCGGGGKKIQTPCKACKGKGAQTRPESLKVKVPAGVKDGAVRTVRSAGETAQDGTGDLHIHISVADHEFFSLEGADVLCTVPITYPQAVLGATIDVPTLEGRVSMKIPQGTQSGRVFRLRGKGIPVYGGYGKGDQLAKIVVEIPDRIDRRQRKLIKELAEALGDQSHPQRDRFLGKLRSLLD